MALLIRPAARETHRVDFGQYRCSPETRALRAGTDPVVAAALRNVAAVEEVDVLDFYAAAAALGASSPMEVAPYTLCGDAKSHRYTLWAWDNVAAYRELPPEGASPAAPPGLQGPPPQQEPSQGAAGFRQPEKDASCGFRMSDRKWVRDAILVHYRKKDILRPVPEADALRALGFAWMAAGETLPVCTFTVSLVQNPTPRMRAQMQALAASRAPPPFPAHRR